MPSRERPPERPAVVAGIVFAMDVEADAFVRLSEGTVRYETAGRTCHEGVVAGARVAWCVAGTGGVAAAAATRLLIDGHRPRTVISAGFAGGLDPRLRRGTTVFPCRAVDHVGGGSVRLAVQPVMGEDRDGPAEDPPFIATVDHVLTTVADKRSLRLATGAAIVDMETLSVATTARDAGLPCIAVRVVSDAAEEELPREIRTLVQPTSAMRRVGAALAAIGRRPAVAADLWRLWEHAVVDGRALATALARTVRMLSAAASRD